MSGTVYGGNTPYTITVTPTPWQSGGSSADEDPYALPGGTTSPPVANSVYPLSAVPSTPDAATVPYPTLATVPTPDAATVPTPTVSGDGSSASSTSASGGTGSGISGLLGEIATRFSVLLLGLLLLIVGLVWSMHEAK